MSTAPIPLTSSRRRVIKELLQLIEHGECLLEISPDGTTTLSLTTTQGDGFTLNVSAPTFTLLPDRSGISACPVCRRAVISPTGSTSAAR